MNVVGTGGQSGFDRWAHIKAVLLAPRSLVACLMGFMTTCCAALLADLRDAALVGQHAWTSSLLGHARGHQPHQCRSCCFQQPGRCQHLVGWQLGPSAICQPQVSWLNLPRVWQPVTCTSTAGPECGGCLCAAAGKFYRPLV